MSLRDALENLRDVLESSGIPYMVTGSIASSVHGVPRATQDIDVVIEPTRDQLIALMEKLGDPDYAADRIDALDALRLRSMFSVIDRRGIWKIDFIVRKNRPFSKREFGRRQQLRILDVALYAATPEDVLLAKLEWAKLGESERQIRDAAGIIEIQREKLTESTWSAGRQRWTSRINCTRPRLKQQGSLIHVSFATTAQPEVGVR